MEMNNACLCQSCAMEMTDSDRGTNADGSPSGDYCKYCFSGGEFTKRLTMEEKMNEDISFWTEGGLTPEEAWAEMAKVFPTLKRWREKG